MSETRSLGPSASMARVTRRDGPPATVVRAGDSSGEHHISPRKPEPGQETAKELWEAAVELIHRSTSVLLICHVSPDGDAIGSLLGLGLGLSVLGKMPTLACESAPPAKFSFLSGFESIVSEIDPTSFDLVIALDSSDVSRLGSVYDVDRLSDIPLINIDHHVTNLYFGEVNLVDSSAASTAEIVLSLLDYLGVSINSDQATDLPSRALAISAKPARKLRGIANCLLTGIVTDTLGFRTSNVTPRVMEAAMRLMEAGASLSQITYHAFNQRPLAELGLLARGLGRIQAEDGLAWSEITLADRHACGDTSNGDIGLVGMLVRTKEVHIAAVFTEKTNNQVEIGFRADPGFDVAQLALSLGGGGHPAASGCTIEGPLETAKARVLPMLRAALKEQRGRNIS
jgi:phosphoesterase RecJ-like protein